MVEITIFTDIISSKLVVSFDEALKLRTKMISQMNNGHTVIFGDDLLNPQYIRAISFKSVKNKEVADDTEV